MSGKNESSKDKDYNGDWKEINRDIADYIYLNNLDENEPLPNASKFTKIIKIFQPKKEEWLKREGFNDPYPKQESDYYTPEWLEDDDIHFNNKYLNILISNLNLRKEKMNKYGLPDYYEEKP